jgi:flagellar hook-associated protein 2
MAGIQLSGLASGLDTQSLISQLMAVDEAPRASLTNKQTQIQTKETALKTLQAKLQTLSSAAQDLSSPVAWNPVQEIDSSDTTKITAAQTSGAGPGSYTLAVSQLASSEQRTFAYQPQAGGDTISINGTPISVQAGATIDDVVGDINANTDAGVFAVNVNGALVLASKTTGNAGAFTASGTSLTEDTTKHRAAQQAQYTLDGVAQTPSDSNTITSAVPGVSLTLKSPTPGTTITVGNPTVDTGTITTKAKAFVDAYNDAMDYMRTEVSEQPDSSDPSKGVLYGDMMVGNLMDSLRDSVGQVFDSVGNPTSMNLLAQAGISTGATTARTRSSASSRSTRPRSPTRWPPTPTASSGCSARPRGSTASGSPSRPSSIPTPRPAGSSTPRTRTPTATSRTCPTSSPTSTSACPSSRRTTRTCSRTWRRRSRRCSRRAPTSRRASARRPPPRARAGRRVERRSSRPQPLRRPSDDRMDPLNASPVQEDPE